MIVGEKELELLSDIIYKKLREEFEIKHLSGNLLHTIKISKTSDEIKIEIPAKTYNMLLYQTKGVVVHTNHGSYASKLDKEGSSFYTYNKGTRAGAIRIDPKNHKGYVDKVINGAIQEWRGILGEKVQKVEH